MAKIITNLTRTHIELPLLDAPEYIHSRERLEVGDDQITSDTQRYQRAGLISIDDAPAQFAPIEQPAASQEDIDNGE